MLGWLSPRGEEKKRGFLGRPFGGGGGGRKEGRPSSSSCPFPGEGGRSNQGGELVGHLRTKPSTQILSFPVLPVVSEVREVELDSALPWSWARIISYMSDIHYGGFMFDVDLRPRLYFF